MGLRLNLRQAIYVLSDALDLVGVDDVAHGKRVGYLARRTGEALGLSPAAQDEALDAGLFHDCGVSSTREHRAITAALDWTGDDGHCRRGEALVLGVPPLARMAPIIRWHHAHATDLAATGLPEPEALLANLVFLADRVDVLVGAARDRDVLSARAPVRQAVIDHRGGLFRSDLVEAFLDVSAPEAFWLTLEPRSLGPWLGQAARRQGDRELTLAELRSVAAMLASVVDAKSPFTAEHSHRVAAVAAALARLAGLEAERCGWVEVAGLLHDIGKLRVPDAVLDKPGELDKAERIRITRHAFDTWQILSRIDGLEEIARWAAYHHEWVRGGGYPFGVDGDALSVEARIVAVADMFQALRQDRPYRGRMPLHQSLQMVDNAATAGKLDPDLVALLHGNLDLCELAATGAQA